jgi:hypothetical protein
MKIEPFNFATTHWAEVGRTETPGETGVAYQRVRQFGDIRVRMVEYSPGYRADHWCEKGHIILCLEGELHTELADGTVHVLKPGMSYQVGDGAPADGSAGLRLSPTADGSAGLRLSPTAHRSSAPIGVKLFVVD